MWVQTIDGDTIVDISAMESLCIAAQDRGGYVINAVSCTGDYYKLAEFKTRSQARDALVEIMDQLNEEGC